MTMHSMYVFIDQTRTVSERISVLWSMINLHQQRR